MITTEQNVFFRFSKLLTLREMPSKLSRMLQLALATCHSLSQMKERYIGDPLDLKMFEASKWVCFDHLIWCGT